MTAPSSHHRSRGRAAVISQRSVARGYREMALSYSSGTHAAHPAPEDPPLPRPGTFFTLLPVNYPTPLLRRPFAYSDANPGGFSFIYEIRGKATQGFSELEPGDLVDWIGPLGTGFPDPPDGSCPVLAAGGIGIGPVLYLARRLAGKGFSPVVALGARTADLVPAVDWPKSAEVRVCTEDGTAGMKGNALDGLAGRIPDNAVFYSCGPRPMMSALHVTADSAGRPCWVSLEEMMACGVGACKGCAVEVADPYTTPVYKCACTDGPVFDSKEIVW